MQYEQWKTERHKCLTCKHCLVKDDPDQDKPGTIMRCRRELYAPLPYCIDARTETCGLEAKNREPK